MTMIACTLNNGFPIVHSDILISDKTRGEEFYVPAFNTNLLDLLPYGREFYPSALKRKAFVVTERVCFVFAGKVLCAGKFLEDLRRRCAIFDNITLEQLSDFLKEYSDEPDFHEFSFFLIFMDQVDEGFRPVIFASEGFVEKEIGFFGKIYLLGSGADDFSAAAEYIDESRSSAPNSPAEAVQSNMALISTILAKERINPTSFLNNWGAGIETIWFDGHKFVNLEQITFAFNHWDLNAQSAFGYPTPTKFTNYHYTNDSLFILDIEADKGRSTIKGDTVIVECNHDNLKFGFFVVQAIDCKDEVIWKDYFDKRSFESTFVGMCYIIMRGRQFFTPGEFRGRRDVKIEFKYGKGVRIEVARHLYENVASISKEMNL